MSDRFEDLTRQFAGASSRRSVLRGLGVAVVGATAATVLKPFRAHAQIECSAGLAKCGDGCCPAGQGCVNASTGKCACNPANNVACGTGCCPKGDTCSDKASITCCCPGQTPCGTSCCVGGVACIDKNAGLCGCPAGTHQCGKGEAATCCPSGQACPSTAPAAAPSVSCPTPRQTGKSYATPCSQGVCTPCCSSVGCPNAGDICVNGCCQSGPTCSCSETNVCQAGPGFTCSSGQYCAKQGNGPFHCANCSPCASGNVCPQGQFCNDAGCCVCFGG